MKNAKKPMDNKIDNKKPLYNMEDVENLANKYRATSAKELGKLENALLDNSINLNGLTEALGTASKNLDMMAEEVTAKWDRLRNDHINNALTRNNDDKNRLKEFEVGKDLLEYKLSLENENKVLAHKELTIDRKLDSMLNNGLQRQTMPYVQKIAPTNRGTFKTRILGTINPDNSLVKKYKKILEAKEIIQIDEKLDLSSLENPNYAFENKFLGTNINDIPKYAFRFDTQKEMENGIQYYAYKKRKKVQVLDANKVPTGEVDYGYEVIVSDNPGTEYSISYTYDKRVRSARRMSEDVSEDYSITMVGRDAKLGGYVENLNRKSVHNVISIQDIKNNVCVEMASDTFKYMMLSEDNMVRIKKLLKKIHYVTSTGEKRPYEAIIQAVTNTPPVFTTIMRPNKNEKSVIRFVLANKDLFDGTPPLNQLMAIENKEIGNDVLVGKLLPNNPNFQFIYNEYKIMLADVKNRRDFIQDKLLDIAKNIDKLELEKATLIVSTTSTVLEILVEENKQMDTIKKDTSLMLYEMKKYKNLLSAVSTVHNTLGHTAIELVQKEHNLAKTLGELEYRAKLLEERAAKKAHNYKLIQIDKEFKRDKEMEEVKKKHKIAILKEEYRLGLKQTVHKTGAELAKQKIIIDGDKDIKKMSIDGDKDIKKMSIDGDKDIKKIDKDIKKMSIDGDKVIKKMSIKGDKVIKEMDVKVNKKKIKAQTRLDKSKLKLEEKKNKQSYELDKAKLELEKIIQKQKIILAVDELDLNRAKILAELELKRIELIQRDNAMVMNMASKITSESLGMQLENGEGSYRLSNKKKPMFKPEDVVDFVSSRVSEYMAMRF